MKQNTVVAPPCVHSCSGFSNGPGITARVSPHATGPAAAIAVAAVAGSGSPGTASNATVAAPSTTNASSEGHAALAPPRHETVTTASKAR